jgi:predicted MFS family arabinose efflux permease
MPGVSEVVPRAELSWAKVAVLAVSAGAIAANLYYVQPLLHLISRDFHAGEGSVGLTITVTQATFAVGLVLVLPMGDLFGRGKLLTVLLVLSAIGLAGVGLAPNLAALLVAFGLVGLANVAAQVIVPAAASLTDGENRGKVVGTVISGLLTGMLLARTVSGVIGEVVGWRAMFFFDSGLMLINALVMRRVLKDPPATAPRPSYLGTLRSIPGLFRKYHQLPIRAVLGAVAFAAFSLFWSTVAFVLSGDHYHYSPSTIGLFGLLGAAGALAANQFGRVPGPARLFPTALTVGLIGLSFVILIPASHSVVWMLIGIVVLDVGAQGLNVLNQRLIYDVEPSEHSRANSGYMTCYFIGGAVGSAVGSVAWTMAGWTGVCIAGVVIAALGAAMWPKVRTAQTA